MGSSLNFDWFGIRLPLVPRGDILAAIEHATPAHPVRIATINPEFCVTAVQDPKYAQTLSLMTHGVIDGFGLWAALKLFGKNPPERYQGATLVHELFEKYADGSKTFGFLGGLENEAAEARAALIEQFPNLTICFAESGGRYTAGERPHEGTLNDLTTTRPDILLVGMGAPRQESWIIAAKNAGYTPAVAIGVGGTFAFYTKKVRAPKLFQVLGLEWLYRALTEPKHWRRLWRAIPVFAWYVVTKKNSSG
jgi:N-acetylglucosaminyldiphosphoundecaprenol N-acetyl-beta-D-mannosaminyltransferase